MRALAALPALAVLAVLPLMADAEAQVSEVHTFIIPMNNQQGSTASEFAVNLGAHELEANPFNHCTVHYPDYESLVPIPPSRGSPWQWWIGGRTAVGVTADSGTLCHNWGLLYYGDHRSLPNNTEVISAELDVHVWQTVNPKNCQVLLTEFPVRPRSHDDIGTLGDRTAAFDNDDIVRDLRARVSAALNADTFIPERHVVFDDNFCTGNGAKTLTFPEPTFPLLFKALKGEVNREFSDSFRPFFSRTSLLLTVAQNNATTQPDDHISSSQISLEEFRVTLRIPTITDTRTVTNGGVEVITLYSRDDALSSASGTCLNVNHAYEGHSSFAVVAVNHSPVIDTRSQCAATALVMDMNYPDGVDFTAMGITYLDNTIDGAEINCDVFVSPVVSETEEYEHWYTAIMRKGYGVNPNTYTLASNVESCHMENTLTNLTATVDILAERLQDIRDERRFSFLGPNVHLSDIDWTKFALVIAPHNTTWPANSQDTGLIQYTQSPIVSSRHDGFKPWPITVFSGGSFHPSSILLEWDEPPPAPLPYIGYLISEVTPFGDVVIGNPTVDDRSFLIGNLHPGVQYTFKISAVTSVGDTNYGPEAVLTIQTLSFDRPGTLVPFNEVAPDPDAILNPVNIYTQRGPTDILGPNVALITLDWAEHIDLACTYELTFARNGGNLTLNPVLNNGRFTYSFTINGTQHDIFEMHCIDPPNDIDLHYVLPQTEFEFLDQLMNFQTGVYGTEGQVGTMDMVAMSLILVSFLGFNRVSPTIGVISALAILSFAAYMGILDFPIAMITGITLVVFFAIVTNRKRRP